MRKENIEHYVGKMVVILSRAKSNGNILLTYLDTVLFFCLLTMNDALWTEMEVYF